MSGLPLVICVGGSGSSDLRNTLSSIGGAPVACTAASVEEAAECAGLARVTRLPSWPGRSQAFREALAVAPDRDLVLLAAGVRLRYGAMRRTADALADGAGVVVLAGSRREAAALRRRLRLFRRARLDPGSGIALSAPSAQALRNANWFERDAALTVEHVDRIAGPIRVLARAIDPPPPAAPAHMTVTVLVPAHNEESWIGHTIRSLRAQSRLPDRIVVIDDGSSDRTGTVARSLGASVVRPAKKTGQKATALNYGLQFVDTDAVIVVDADTMFHRDAIKHLMDEIERGADATCGAVMPLIERGVWARGRAVEYAVAMRVHKRVQHGLGSVFVLSGCISAFKTASLRAIGGYSERTATDDVDVTWSLLTGGYRVAYTPAAIAYTVEPPSWRLYKAQMRRWAGALFQTLPFHVKRLYKKPSLALILASALWDAVTVPLMLALTVALLIAGQVEVSWIVGGWTALAIGISFVAAASVMGLRRALISFPASLMMLWTNLYFFMEAFGREWILRRRSLVWVKGH